MQIDQSYLLQYPVFIVPKVRNYFPVAVFFTDVWHVEVHKMYDAIGISQFDKESSLFEVKIFIIAGKMG